MELIDDALLLNSPVFSLEIHRHLPFLGELSEQRCSNNQSDLECLSTNIMPQTRGFHLHSLVYEWIIKCTLGMASTTTPKIKYYADIFMIPDQPNVPHVPQLLARPACTTRNPCLTITREPRPLNFHRPSPLFTSWHRCSGAVGRVPSQRPGPSSTAAALPQSPRSPQPCSPYRDPALCPSSAP